MTAYIDVDNITAQAREVKFSRTLLTIIASIFYGIGWIFGAAWLAVVWCAIAIKVGFNEGRKARQEHPR